MKDLTQLIFNLTEVVENIIAMNPTSIQELESGVGEATRQIGAQLIKFKLEGMDKSANEANKCGCKALMHKRKRGKKFYLHLAELW